MKNNLFLLPFAFFSSLSLATTLELMHGGAYHPPAQSEEEPIQSSAVTYYGQVKSIVDAHCQGCHSQGGMAPFPLDSYATVKKWGPMILDAIDNRRMPPWNANALPGHELKYDFSLSDEKIKIFHDWADAKYPLGDANNPGAPILLENPAIHAPDVTMGMAAPFTPDTANRDVYRCFVIGESGDSEYFVTGFSSHSTNQRIVHHIAVVAFDQQYAGDIAAMDAADPGPGYTCFGRPVAEGYDDVPTRHVGGAGYPAVNFAYPEGAGMRIPPRTTFVMQVHYSVHGTSALTKFDDQTSVSFKTTKAVEHDLANLFFFKDEWVTKAAMPIPAGKKEVILDFAAEPRDTLAGKGSKGMLSLDNGIYIHSVAPHQHLLGTGLRLYQQRLDGTEELVFSNWDRYDFHFQWTFFFEKPLFLAAGEKLRLECKWDNSAENQVLDANGNIREPVDVNWGEGSKDEMCLVVMGITERWYESSVK